MSTLHLALVTGAGSGIGRAVALALASEHTHVIAAGRRLAPLRETAALGGKWVIPVACDVATPAGRASLVATARNSGEVRYLVHAAGVHHIAPLTAMTEATWQELMTINVNARLFLTLELLPLLTPKARVLFVGSRSATRPRAGAAAYCVTQAASHMLQQCLAMELAMRGIDIGSAIPSPARTPMVERQLSADPTVYPDAANYRRARDDGKLVSTTAVGAFFRWLLMQTSSDDFSRREWNITDAEHHSNWLGTIDLYDRSG